MIRLAQIQNRLLVPVLHVARNVGEGERERKRVSILKMKAEKRKSKGRRRRRESVHCTAISVRLFTHTSSM